MVAISKNFTKYLIKGAGLAALGIVAYDSHVVGKLQSDVYSKTADANACMDRYNNTQYLSSPSITTAKLKKGVFNLEMEDNTRNFITSGLGYFKGFASMLVSSIVPLGLGLGALFGKGLVAKGSGIGLGIYGIVKLFKDVLGFGHSNDLKSKF